MKGGNVRPLGTYETAVRLRHGSGQRPALQLRDNTVIRAVQNQGRDPDIHCGIYRVPAEQQGME